MINVSYMMYIYIYVYDDDLVGGISTPLKNMKVQLG